MFIADARLQGAWHSGSPMSNQVGAILIADLQARDGDFGCTATASARELARIARRQRADDCNGTGCEAVLSLDGKIDTTALGDSNFSGDS